MIEDHGSISSTSEYDSLVRLESFGENGSLFKNSRQVRVSGRLLALTGRKMAVDEAEGRIIQHEARDNCTLDTG